MAEAESVYAVYERLIKTGMDPKDAAKQAQSTTGVALRSGRPISKALKFSSKGTTYGNEFIGLYRQRLHR